MSIEMRHQSSFEFKENVEPSQDKNRKPCVIKSINEKIDQKKKAEESKALSRVISRVDHLLG